MGCSKTLVWFRQDLRLRDNEALTWAAGQGAIVPLYIQDSSSNNLWAPGAASRWWLHHSLNALSQDLQCRGASLVLRSGNPISVLLDLVHETGATAVAWNRRYDPYGMSQDEMVRDCLYQEGVDVYDFQDFLLKEPCETLNGAKLPYRVFTPFWKALSAGFVPQASLDVPTIQEIGAVRSEVLSDWGLLPTIPWDSGMKTRWKPGETGAWRQLASFQNKVDVYAHDRDFPALKGSACLSPHLHFGEISPHSVWRVVPHQESFLRQLGWRDFSAYLLYHFPHFPEVPFVDKFQNFPWNDNEDHFKAWSRGQTGYPIVDAGMRELWTTGYMHNRVRMIVASFLTKHLLIPWQRGEAWFWDTLVDADLANNAASWQWVAGCGADAAPYFRIFNPVLQGKKFDPQGTYVKEWVPELAFLETKFIHAPWEADAFALRAGGIELGKTYPYPIVDHGVARHRALAAYRTLGGDHET